MLNKKADILYCGVNSSKISKAHPELDSSVLAILSYWIGERYNIRLRKNSGMPKPWTDNLILQRYKFTNVRREHDRESQWLIKNIVNSSLSYDSKLLHCILFRLFNISSTFENIGFVDFDAVDYNKVFKLVTSPSNIDRIWFSNAFYTSGPKSIANKLFGKHHPVINIVHLVESYHNSGIVDRISECSSQKEVFEALSSLPGIGEFLAYQIFVDFTYISEFPFSENEFTIAGPGCKRGLDLLFTDRAGLTYEECLFWLRDNQQILNIDFKALFCDLPDYDQCMNVMSFENCFCELSKYARALDGTGRPRIRYDG